MSRRWGAPRVARPPPQTSHPGNDYSSAVQRCLSADQPVRGMNRASPDWGNGIYASGGRGILGLSDAGFTALGLPQPAADIHRRVVARRSRCRTVGKPKWCDRRAGHNCRVDVRQAPGMGRTDAHADSVRVRGRSVSRRCSGPNHQRRASCQVRSMTACWARSP